jgi:hypothetical protein
MREIIGDVTEHPEARCQECGGPNIVWSAGNYLWNYVVGGPDGILCIPCFTRAAARKKVCVKFAGDNLGIIRATWNWTND